MNTVRDFIKSCSIKNPDVNFVVLRKRKPTEPPSESGNMILFMLNALAPLDEVIKFNEDMIKDTLDMEIKHWDMCFKGGNTYFQLWVDIDFKCRLWQ